MKVFVTKAKSQWLSPYTIAEKIFFWKDTDWVYESDRVDKFVTFIYPACELLQKIRQRLFPQIQYVKIDRHDVWSLDARLAPIIAAALIQFKKDKQGVPQDYIGNDEHIDIGPAEAAWNADLDSMIWSFTEYTKDWDSQYMTGEIDWVVTEHPDGTVSRTDYGPNHTFKYDHEGAQAHQAKIQHGIDLFAKHYTSLWS